VKKKILIVDDEADIVEGLKFELENNGFECLVSFDGLSAVEMVKKEEPDLILMDVMMPKKNGYQVCRLLKWDDKYKHIPIVLLTARAQEADKQLGQSTGADYYITKPFDLDDLIRCVKSCLGTL
jgi:DNA-binding response OmpR family regulator